MSAETAAHVLKRMSKPVRANPILFSVNGVGFGFAGTALRHPDLDADMFVRMHWFKIVFVPIIPLGIYLLSNPVDKDGRARGGSYYIHRAVKIAGVSRVWGAGGFWGMFFSAWGIALALIAMIALIGVLLSLAGSR